MRTKTETTYHVPENGERVLLDPWTAPTGEDVIGWEALSVHGHVLGTVELISDGTYYVYGGPDDAVEIDSVPPDKLHWAVYQLYYASYGVPLPNGDHVGTIVSDEDANDGAPFRRTVVVAPADTDDLFRPDNRTIGHVDLDGETGLWYGVESGGTINLVVTAGWETPFQAARAVYAYTRAN